MQIIKADLYGELGAPTTEVPLHHLDLWDRQAAKLQTGALIRLTIPTDEAKRATDELRDGIQSLRIAIEQHRTEVVRSTFVSVQRAFRKCQESYGVADTR
jgi:hypothetical protein